MHIVAQSQDCDSQLQTSLIGHTIHSKAKKPLKENAANETSR